jgi:hypothetical protein
MEMAVFFNQIAIPVISKVHEVGDEMMKMGVEVSD